MIERLNPPPGTSFSGWSASVLPHVLHLPSLPPLYHKNMTRRRRHVTANMPIFTISTQFARSVIAGREQLVVVARRGIASSLGCQQSLVSCLAGCGSYRLLSLVQCRNVTHRHPPGLARLACKLLEHLLCILNATCLTEVIVAAQLRHAIFFYLGHGRIFTVKA